MPPLLSRRWILTTLLVVLACGVMARLGFWQLDRLEQRRFFNARVQAQLDQPPLTLHGQALPSGLVDMEYREVVVQGEYDHTGQVALLNQAHENRLGVRLLTPLRVQGSQQVILVDRGWVPYEDFSAGQLEQYEEPGLVRVEGVIRRSQSRPDFGRRSDPPPVPGGDRLESYYLANVERIAAELPYPLAPVYVQQSPNPAWTGLPYRTELHLELSEGSHLGYAVQWFSFAALLGFGYPLYVRREEVTLEKGDLQSPGYIRPTRTGEDKV